MVRHLATGADADVARRPERLARALAGFDAATIATTHGFCHQMLAGLGIAADIDADVTFTESTGDIVTEVVNDFYVRAYAQATDQPTRSLSLRPPKSPRTRSATGLHRLEPVAAAPAPEADVRRRLAESVRAEVELRKESRRVMDYDDLLEHCAAR